MILEQQCSETRTLVVIQGREGPFHPSDASLRRKLRHHSTSLCVTMRLSCFFTTGAESQNKRWASQRVTNNTDTHTEERLRTVFRLAVWQIIHQIIIIPFSKNKFVNLNEFCVFLSRTSPAGLRIASVQELLLGRRDAAVPGAGVIRPLDAGVVLSLPAIHLLVDHQVGPQTLLRRGDLTGQGGAAHNLDTGHRWGEKKKSCLEFSPNLASQKQRKRI